VAPCKALQMSQAILLVLICLTPPSLIELYSVEFRVQCTRIDQAWWDWSRLTDLSSAMTTSCALSVLARRSLVTHTATTITEYGNYSESRQLGGQTLPTYGYMCVMRDHKTDPLSMAWTAVPLQYNRLCAKTDLLVRSWGSRLVKEFAWPTKIIH